MSHTDNIGHTETVETTTSDNRLEIDASMQLDTTAIVLYIFFHSWFRVNRLESIYGILGARGTLNFLVTSNLHSYIHYGYIHGTII